MFYSTAPPPPPDSISFVFTCTSINFTWVPPSSQCIGSYEVESNATNSTLTTTDTSVSIPLAGLTATTYYVSVASVDTANRTGEYTDIISFVLKGIIIYNTMLILCIDVNGL